MPRLLLLAALSLAWSPWVAQAQSAAPDTLGLATLPARLDQLASYELDEVVWLARCMLSESDRGDEQYLVGWVVRNRVETQFRGRTYREVILEPRQFSAFNDPTPRRDYLTRLGVQDRGPAWRTALALALKVYEAPASHRPFDLTTRHFYSPISMVGRTKPRWAEDATPLSSEALGVDPQRFQFFTGLDETQDPHDLSPHLVDADPSQFDQARSRLADRRARLRQRRSRLGERRVGVVGPERPKAPVLAVPARPKPGGNR
ncbi:MAG: hypothetical protein AAGI71_08460 [Bacteroidota bacterium]